MFLVPTAFVIFCVASVIADSRVSISYGFSQFNAAIFFTIVPCILILEEFFICQLMHKGIALKSILKFALKWLRHISV